jgi:hypothetical protein
VNRRKNVSNIGNPGRFAKEIDAKYRVSTDFLNRRKNASNFGNPGRFAKDIPTKKAALSSSLFISDSEYLS